MVPEIRVGRIDRAGLGWIEGVLERAGWETAVTNQRRGSGLIAGNRGSRGGTVTLLRKTLNERSVSNRRDGREG